MDLDDEELKATRNKFYHKNKEINKKQINKVVKRIIKSEEVKNN